VKVTIKITFVFIMLLVSANIINAQNSVRFDDHGLYLVQNGMIKEIHTKKDYVIQCAFFWENYLVLEGLSPITYIYNIRTGAMSDLIDDNITKLERKNKLTVYFGSRFRGYWKYEYKYDSLKLLSKISLKSDPFPDSQISSYFYADAFGEKKYWQGTIKRKMNDRLFRYIGEKFYLDVHYGPEIDLTGKYFDPLVLGGRNNIFIVIMQGIPYFSH